MRERSGGKETSEKKIREESNGAERQRLLGKPGLIGGPED